MRRTVLSNRTSKDELIISDLYDFDYVKIEVLVQQLNYALEVTREFRA
jgi:hypothetical protein